MSERSDRQNRLHLRFCTAILEHMRAEAPPGVEPTISDGDIYGGIAILCGAMLAKMPDEDVEASIEELIDAIRLNIAAFRADDSGIEGHLMQ